MPSPWEYKAGTYVQVFDDRGRSWFGQIMAVVHDHYKVRVGGTGVESKASTAISGYSLDDPDLVTVPIQNTAPHSAMAKVGAAAWGDTYMVAAGIIVEVMKGQNDSYVDFIRELLEAIRRVPIGAEILWEFDPRNAANHFRQIDDGAGDGPSQGMFRGATLVVSQPGVGGALETKSLGGRLLEAEKKKGGKAAGAPTWAKPSVPLVKFYNRPMGVVSLSGDTIQLDPEGVLKHPDFLDRNDYATPFFHEMCHAWYDQVGIFALRTTGAVGGPGKAHGLSDKEMGASFDLGDNVEEQYVSGLLAGKGVKFCENRYRFQTDLALRRSYKAVKIAADAGVGAFNWNGRPYTDPLEVLRANGWKV